MSTAPQSRQTAVDGLVLTSEVHGAGQPVLLLHGWGGRIDSMRMVADRLASKGYACHVLDLPGFGSSTLPPETWGVPEYARCVVGYLEKHALTQVHLIGHSFGGRISLVLGADYPAHVHKIVLTASAGVLPPVSAGQFLRKAAFETANGLLGLPGVNRLQKPFRDWAKQRFGSEDLRNAGALEPIFRRVITQDLLPYAARIKAPTLLIWGGADVDTPLWQSKKLEQAIPDAGLVVFDGAGHFAYQERLIDFVRIVETFFKPPTSPHTTTTGVA